MTTQLTILDVGHGSCAVLSDKGSVGVIDAGKGPHVSLYLASIGVTEVDLVVISHTDDDHLSGIVGLLSSEKIKIKAVALNADSVKDTKIWRDVRALISSKHNEGKVQLLVGVFRGIVKDWKGAEVTLEVLSPSAFDVMAGVGGKDGEGKKISANSGSIVIRAAHKDGQKVLLAADMEEQTLNELLSNKLDLSASTLVFPHHGGKPGTDATVKFTERLLEAVKPASVLFSNGRGKYDAPRREIVAAVCATNSYVACTQISKNCHSKTFPQDLNKLQFSAGAHEGHSCAGTITVDFKTGQPQSERVLQHVEFVAKLESPMCKQQKNEALPGNGLLH